MFDTSKINLFLLRMIISFIYFQTRFELIVIGERLSECTNSDMLMIIIWLKEVVELPLWLYMESSACESLRLSSFPFWMLHYSEGNIITIKIMTLKYEKLYVLLYSFS